MNQNKNNDLFFLKKMLILFPIDSICGRIVERIISFVKHYNLFINKKIRKIEPVEIIDEDPD